DRVVVYNLDSSNNLIDRLADAVLGAPDLSTYGAGGRSQSVMHWPESLAFDTTHNWLYVGEYWNKRVLVFDTAGITNGENALYVLGQTNFTNNTTGTSATQFDA